MSVNLLINELKKNHEWYKTKGKKFKRLSYGMRVAYMLLFAISAMTMSVLGASAISVSLSIAGAAILIADKSFGVTRNWLEFSFLEVKIASSIALVQFFDERGDHDAALGEFKSTVAAIERETLGWQVDIREGLSEMKKLMPQKET